jgi:hypothetical protein
MYPDPTRVRPSGVPNRRNLHTNHTPSLGPAIKVGRASGSK